MHINEVGEALEKLLLQQVLVLHCRWHVRAQGEPAKVQDLGHELNRTAQRSVECAPLRHHARLLGVLSGQRQTRVGRGELVALQVVKGDTVEGAGGCYPPTNLGRECFPVSQAPKFWVDGDAACGSGVHQVRVDDLAKAGRTHCIIGRVIFAHHQRVRSRQLAQRVAHDRHPLLEVRLHGSRRALTLDPRAELKRSLGHLPFVGG